MFPIQIATSIEQFDDLKNMSDEEVVGHLKVHEERLRGYEDKEEKKYLLLTHEEWLTEVLKLDLADSAIKKTLIFKNTKIGVTLESL